TPPLLSLTLDALRSSMREQVSPITPPGTTGRGRPLRRRDGGDRAVGWRDRLVVERMRRMSFTPYDRPVRAAFVGLGRIYDLNMRAYVENPDVDVVALVDPSAERREQRQLDWPDARTFASAAELAASGLE